MSTLKADASCGAAARDCNPCAFDVRKQFNDDSWKYGDADWNFELSRSYSGLTPNEAYHGGLKNHVQGFARLNGLGARYAMLHSGGLKQNGTRVAALSLIESYNGKFALTGLIALDAAAAHTAGLFTLGAYAGTFSRDGHLMLVDMRTGIGTVAEYELAVPTPRARGISTRSGGVGMAKLAGGGYLLLANEGGDGASSGRSHFFRIDADLSTLAPEHITSLPFEDLGTYQYRAEERGPGDYHHSENLALITECATGDLYSVHVGSSNATNGEDSLGRTFWRVSQVVLGPEGPRLALVGTYTRASDLWRCFGRGGGSAFVDAGGRIELVCHQRAHDKGAVLAWDFWRHATDGPLEAEPIVVTPDAMDLGISE